MLLLLQVFSKVQLGLGVSPGDSLRMSSSSMQSVVSALGDE